MDLHELAKRLTPQKTILFLGSGAAVGCGGPTGCELAKALVVDLAPGDIASDDLVEVASILELRCGRKAIIEAVRKQLRPLQPTGAMLSLPDFGWNAIFTTNFDQLVESAYKRRGQQTKVIRSNFDYDKLETDEGTPVFKIHGCLSQDSVDGHRSRMTLTERDYDEYPEFRESLFKRLSLDLMTKDILVIGHSLRDPHIKRDMAEASRLQREKSTGGNIYVLIYTKDPDRVALLEQKGFGVATGSLEELLLALDSPLAVPTIREDVAGDDFLSTQQRVATVDVVHARGLAPNASELFHGSPATYADVEAGLTFGRSAEPAILAALSDDKRPFAVITGVAGTGKTSAARRIVHELSRRGYRAWEHAAEFPLQAGAWLDVDKKLKAVKETGVLLIDDCADSLRQVNKLCAALGRDPAPALQVVMTANHSEWYPRIKTPAIFERGHHVVLCDLQQSELNSLVNLLDSQPSIAKHVERSFMQLSRQEKLRRLSSRCSSDMFVCLKNIFSFESLDTILLQEFSRLDGPLQEIYRHVATIQAAGATVHRQLILRALALPLGSLPDYLSRLDGLIAEYVVSESQGIFAWRTRHEVIAQIISRYKFSNESDLFDFFCTIIDNLNPTVWIELQMIRDLCGRDFGIGRLSDPDQQCVLLRRLIDAVPAERVPRHRYVSTLLRKGDLNAAEDALRDAVATVKLDPPLLRYGVQLRMNRALDTLGLARQDRIAMLREAEREAEYGIERFPSDKLAYVAYARVGEAIAKEANDISTLDAAIAAMRGAAERLLDPHLDDEVRHFEGRRFALSGNRA